MKVTEVKIYLSENSDKCKAFASIVIDDSFIVRDLKVVEGMNGLFVSMPSRRKKDGTFKDIAHPLNSETREMIEKSILDAYNSAKKAPSSQY